MHYMYCILCICILCIELCIVLSIVILKLVTNQPTDLQTDRQTDIDRYGAAIAAKSDYSLYIFTSFKNEMLNNIENQTQYKAEIHDFVLYFTK